MAAGFWGASDPMKEAWGWPREAGAFSKEQFKEWLNRAQSEGQRGDTLNNFAQDYWADQARLGMGSPEDIRATGQRVMPGVDQVKLDRRGRLNEIGGDFDITHGRVGDRLTGQQQAGFDVENYNRGDINDVYGRIGQRAGDVSRDMVGNIQGTYGRVDTNTGNAYGDMRKRGEGTYADIGKATGTAYDQAQAELAALKPGGELQAARVGRSFAPVAAATARRLRASGVDPNSGEAFNQQSRVENARARAMDDASAASTEGYVDRKTGMIIGRAKELTGATERGLMNDQSLSREKEGILRDNTYAEGRDYRGELARTQGIQNSVDEAWKNDTVTNRGQGYDRNAANTNALNNYDATGWGTRSDLKREQNAEDITGLGLDNEQFDRGAKYVNNDLSVRGQGAQAVTSMGQNALQNSTQGANVARGFGNDAGNNYQQAFQYEAPNAGWGLKAITGAAAAGMNAMAPGSGMVLQGAMGQTPYGQQQRGGYYNPYSIQTPGINPNAPIPGVPGYGGGQYNPYGNIDWGKPGIFR